MKTIIKAALSLFVCALFALPQVSMAGKPAADEPCKFPEDTKTACTTDLRIAYNTIKENEGAFKSENDFVGLTCKVASSELKMTQNKAADAETKLAASVNKVQDLFDQRKLEINIDTLEIKEDLEVARACAYKESIK